MYDNNHYDLWLIYRNLIRIIIRNFTERMDIDKDNIPFVVTLQYS